MHGSRILVVDDSSYARRTSRRLLETMGFEVVEGISGYEALEAYDREHPHFVLLDLVMEGMYGLEVLKWLRLYDPEACVVVASADVQDSTAEAVRLAGGAGYVGKPLHRNKLEALFTQVTPFNGKWLHLPGTGR